MNIEDALMAGLLLRILVCAVVGIIVGAFADRKNRDFLLWSLGSGVVGFFLSPPLGLLGCLIVLAFMPFLCPVCHARMTNQQRNNGKCPKCEAERQSVQRQCGQCRTVYEAGHGGCPSCGSTEFAIPDQEACLRCGSIMAPGVSICPNCSWTYQQIAKSSSD
jgi:RNA polymerase subunit RPABC4/transcription elongation factor Spt4